MSIDFAKIQEQVRSVLKSLAPLKPGGQAAEPPVDPESLDPRLEGAAPTEEGMAAAGEEAGAGQGAGGEEGGEGGEGGEPDGDEAGEGGGDANDAGAEDEGRPVEKSLDEGDAFGNQDFDPEEIRRLEKAYGNGTGEGEPSELIKGGPDLMAVLGTILHAMEDQKVVLQALHDVGPVGGRGLHDRRRGPSEPGRPRSGVSRRRGGRRQHPLPAWPGRSVAQVRASRTGPRLIFLLTDVRRVALGFL